jgi:hypothetical protein
MPNTNPEGLHQKTVEGSLHHSHGAASWKPINRKHSLANATG